MADDKKKKKAPAGAAKTPKGLKTSPAESSPPEERAKEKGKVPSHAGSEPRGFYVVGIGASAGGLNALEKFFESVPEHPGMAFVVIPHLKPGTKSRMPEIVGRHCPLEVMEAVDDTPLRKDRVYIVPPGKDLAIRDTTLHLSERSRTDGPHLPIDAFFRSLAQDQGHRAVGVILSGSGSDGTVGLKAIKEALGMAMVQDPVTAQYDGMPQSAIDSGVADFVLQPEEMPGQLIRYVTYFVRPDQVPEKERDRQALEQVYAVLHKVTGHDFSMYKPKTILRRISKRMSVNQIDVLSHYARYLRSDADETRSLFKELLIGVTNFFRDPEAFEYLKAEVLPKYLADKPERYEFRAWVPGCATGEEAYSVAMILRECLDEIENRMDVQIFATDIDDQAVETARKGVYPDGNALDVSDKRLKRFFNKEDDVYRIKKEVRDKLVFAVQNMIKDPPFTRLDLICCRNLLIYLESELQKKVLPLFHYCLKPDGILFLGTSESIGDFGDLFRTENKKWKIFRSRDVVLDHEVISYPLRPSSDRGYPQPVRPVLKRPPKEDQVERILLSTYVPPSVIVNEQGEALFFHGETGRYLQPAEGKARLNLFDMVRPGLKTHLPAALHQAVRSKAPVVRDRIQVTTNGGTEYVRLRIIPVRQSAAFKGLAVVSFEPILESTPETPSDAGQGQDPSDTDARITQLEEELQYSRESLQTTIEELETSNEELKSTNEELESTNEELQSTNEELETSKEELQSVNEELSTVNAELQDNNEALAKANNDMKNLLDSINVPTVFLDNDLNIKRYTADAAELFNLMDSDLGWPITHLSPNVRYDRLEKDAKDVLKRLKPFTREMQTKGGHWYRMRIMPYRSMDNVIEGVIITFLDIQDMKDIMERLGTAQQALGLAHSIVNTCREPLVVLDQDLRVVSANRSFYNFFKARAEDTLNRSLYELGNGQWDIPALRELLSTIIPRDGVFEDFEVTHDFPHIGERKMVLNARRVPRDEAGQELILLALESAGDES